MKGFQEEASGTHNVVRDYECYWFEGVGVSEFLPTLVARKRHVTISIFTSQFTVAISHRTGQGQHWQPVHWAKQMASEVLLPEMAPESLISLEISRSYAAFVL
jgi:hypothetical protein